MPLVTCKGPSLGTPCPGTIPRLGTIPCHQPKIVIIVMKSIQPLPLVPHPFLRPYVSINSTQQLRLQDKLALLVLLSRLIRLIVLPPHSLLALLAVDVAHLVPAGCHVALDGFRLGGVDDGVEEEGFAVLATEVLGNVSEVIELKNASLKG